MNRWSIKEIRSFSRNITRSLKFSDQHLKLLLNMKLFIWTLVIAMLVTIVASQRFQRGYQGVAMQGGKLFDTSLIRYQHE